MNQEEIEREFTSAGWELDGSFYKHLVIGCTDGLYILAYPETGGTRVAHSLLSSLGPGPQTHPRRRLPYCGKHSPSEFVADHECHGSQASGSSLPVCLDREPDSVRRARL